MKGKRKTDVCEGEKDEKETKWRGREPMKPSLIETCLHVNAVCAPKGYDRFQ